MRTLFHFLVLILFFVVASAWAEVTFKPVVGVSTLSGKTSYDITFGGYDSSYGPWGMESKLEFDLKAALMNVGLEAEVAKGALVFSAGYGFSFTEGSGKMRDRDWFYNDAVNNYYGWNSLVGDTLSDTASPIHLFDLGMKGRLVKRNGVRLYGLLGYEYEKLGTFTMNDYAGMYSGWFTGGVDKPQNGKYQTPILSYEVQYNTYRTGFSVEVDLGDGFGLEGTARAGYVSYSDKDDHILRSRIATGSGHGYEGDGTGAVSWTSRCGFGASVFVRYQSLTADGMQNQYYYGGQLQGESAHVSQTVNSSQTSFGAEITYRFGVRPSGVGKNDKSKKRTRFDQAAGAKPGTTVTAVAATPSPSVGVGTAKTTTEAATPDLAAQVSSTPGLNATPETIPTATPSAPFND